MNLGIDLGIKKQKENIFDVISSYETIIDIQEDLNRVSYISMCLENLSGVYQLIDKGGVTPAIKAVFGQEFLQASMEVTAGDIGRAVGKGLLAFGKAVLGLISKIMNFVKKFVSSKRSDIDAVVARLEPIMKDIQNEPISKGIPVSDIEKLCKLCDEHFKVKPALDISGDNREKDVIRREFLSKFNKSVSADAIVGNDYKLEFKPKSLNDTTPKELGFTSADAFRKALGVVNKAKQDANGVVSNLKNSNTAVERMVKSLEGNQFNNEQSNQGSVQVAFVYAKIIFADIAALVSVENSINAVATACEKHSGRYAKSKDDVSEADTKDGEADTDKE